VFSSKDSVEFMIDIVAEARSHQREVESRKNSSIGDIKKAANLFYNTRIAAIREIESRIAPQS
jgi:hypothetical protein